MLRLDAPFDLGGSRVAAVALAGSPSAFNGELRFYGYGDPRIGEMRGFGATLLPKWRCGNTAAYVCGRSSDGMACAGDSGGGVINSGNPLQLVAVAALARGACQPGGPNGFADVTAPELRRFIDGEAAPPAGPVQTTEASLVATSDGGVRCSAGAWTGATAVTFTFTFSDDAAGGAPPLQDGPAESYSVKSPADAGRRIRCVASVTNPGGTAQVSPEQVLSVPRAWRLTVQGRRVTTQRFDLSFGRRAVLTFTDGQSRRVRRALRRKRQLPMTIPGARAGAYTICLDVTPGGWYTAWRECIVATVNPTAAMLVQRIRTSRRGTRFRVTLAVSPGAIGQRATATWLTARCRTCRAHRVRRSTVRLRDGLTLRAPSVARGRELRLRIRLPELSVDGTRYIAGSKTFRVGRR